jgi:hypothetical protein
MVWRMVFLLGPERADDPAVLLYTQDYLAKAGVGKIFIFVCFVRLCFLSQSRSFDQMAWAFHSDCKKVSISPFSL